MGIETVLRNIFDDAQKKVSSAGLEEHESE